MYYVAVIGKLGPGHLGTGAHKQFTTNSKWTGAQTVVLELVDN